MRLAWLMLGASHAAALTTSATLRSPLAAMSTRHAHSPRFSAPRLRLQDRRDTRVPANADDQLPTLTVWAQQAAAMWVSAAVLGPFCDGRHSAHDVLHYASDSIAGPPWMFTLPGSSTPFLETCWWVPIAFGGAGVILGAAHPLLDRRWGGGPRPPPGWPAALLNVALFVACYDLSGALAQAAATSGAERDVLTLDLPLLACAAAIFAAF